MQVFDVYVGKPKKYKIVELSYICIPQEGQLNLPIS